MSIYSYHKIVWVIFRGSFCVWSCSINSTPVTRSQFYQFQKHVFHISEIEKQYKSQNVLCQAKKLGFSYCTNTRQLNLSKKISSRTKFVSSVSYLSSAQIILNSILQLQVQMPYVSIMRYSPSSLSLLLSKELIRKRKLLQLLLIYHTFSTS